jgi:hypothetical protein
MPEKTCLKQFVLKLGNEAKLLLMALLTILFVIYFIRVLLLLTGSWLVMMEAARNLPYRLFCQIMRRGLVIGFTSFFNADPLSPDPGIFLHPDPRFPKSEPENGLKNAIYLFVNS